MLNTCLLIGRLTKNPELRKTSSGLTIVTANLAVQGKFKNEQGEYPTDFFRVNLWRSLGENFASYCQKGDLVQITAQLRNNNYQDDKGVTHYRNDIVVSEWSKLARPNQVATQSQLTTPTQPNQSNNQTHATTPPPPTNTQAIGNPDPIPPFDDFPPFDDAPPQNFTPSNRDGYGYDGY